VGRAQRLLPEIWVSVQRFQPLNFF
jgi:hypothetical protein